MSFRVHWVSRLLMPFPGMEKLAAHVPELRHAPGQIAAPLLWVSLAALGTRLCLGADPRGLGMALLVQTALVLGAFLLVDVASLHSRAFWLRHLGRDAYRFCFWLLISPGLMGGFLAAQIHLALVRGERLLSREVSFSLGLPFVALGLLMAIRVYRTFSLDRLLYMYVFHPQEGSLVHEGIYAILRHPQYASFLFLDLGLVLLKSTVEGAVLFLPFVAFGVLRIVPEERELLHRFGEAYADYRRATPALVPRGRDWGRLLRVLVAPA